MNENEPDFLQGNDRKLFICESDDSI